MSEETKTKKYENTTVGFVLSVVTLCLGAALAAFIIDAYFIGKEGGDTLIATIILAVLGVVTFIVLILSAVFCLLKGKSWGKLISFSPSLIGILALLVGFIVTRVDYAHSDLRTFGIPEEYQVSLAYENVLKAAEEQGNIQFAIDDDDHNYSKGVDSENKLLDVLKTVTIKDQITESEYVYSSTCVYYILGTDDFRGLKIYDTGYIVSAEEGDLWGPNYHFYYSYDANQFPTILETAGSLLS